MGVVETNMLLHLKHNFIKEFNVVLPILKYFLFKTAIDQTFVFDHGDADIRAEVEQPKKKVESICYAVIWRSSENMLKLI